MRRVSHWVHIHSFSDFTLGAAEASCPACGWATGSPTIEVVSFYLARGESPGYALGVWEAEF